MNVSDKLIMLSEKVAIPVRGFEGEEEHSFSPAQPIHALIENRQCITCIRDIEEIRAHLFEYIAEDEKYTSKEAVQSDILKFNFHFNVLMDIIGVLARLEDQWDRAKLIASKKILEESGNPCNEA